MVELGHANTSTAVCPKRTSECVPAMALAHANLTKTGTHLLPIFNITTVNIHITTITVTTVTIIVIVTVTMTITYNTFWLAIELGYLWEVALVHKFCRSI